MKHQFKLEFDKAWDLRCKGLLDDAIQVLESMSSEGCQSLSFLMVLANTYWEQNNLSQAEQVFRQATELYPSVDHASLGLFHVLMDEERVDEAFDEMRRYLADHTSEEYSRLLKDINSASDI